MDTQFRVGMGGAYGLDYNTMDRRSLARGMTLDAVYFAKVRAYELEVLAILNPPKNKDICTPDKKNRCRLEYGVYLEWACKNCKEINHAR